MHRAVGIAGIDDERARIANGERRIARAALQDRHALHGAVAQDDMTAAAQFDAVETAEGNGRLCERDRGDCGKCGGGEKASGEHEANLGKMAAPP